MGEAMASAALGVVIAERYRLEAELGDGTRASILARQRQLGLRRVVCGKLGPSGTAPGCRSSGPQLGGCSPTGSRLRRRVIKRAGSWLVRNPKSFFWGGKRGGGFFSPRGTYGS